jgi:hypothetical protein
MQALQPVNAIQQIQRCSNNQREGNDQSQEDNPEGKDTIIRGRQSNPQENAGKHHSIKRPLQIIITHQLNHENQRQAGRKTV